MTEETEENSPGDTETTYPYDSDAFPYKRETGIIPYITNGREKKES